MTLDYDIRNGKLIIRLIKDDAILSSIEIPLEELQHLNDSSN